MISFENSFEAQRQKTRNERQTRYRGNLQRTQKNIDERVRTQKQRTHNKSGLATFGDVITGMTVGTLENFWNVATFNWGEVGVGFSEANAWAEDKKELQRKQMLSSTELSDVGKWIRESGGIDKSKDILGEDTLKQLSERKNAFRQNFDEFAARSDFWKENQQYTHNWFEDKIEESPDEEKYNKHEETLFNMNEQLKIVNDPDLKRGLESDIAKQEELFGVFEKKVTDFDRKQQAVLGGLDRAFRSYSEKDIQEWEKGSLEDLGKFVATTAISSLLFSPLVGIGGSVAALGVGMLEQGAESMYSHLFPQEDGANLSKNTSQVVDQYLSIQKRFGIEITHKQFEKQLQQSNTKRIGELEDEIKKYEDNELTRIDYFKSKQETTDDTERLDTHERLTETTEDNLNKETTDNVFLENLEKELEYLGNKHQDKKKKEKNYNNKFFEMFD
jgi:hypothetical protein